MLTHASILSRRKCRSALRHSKDNNNKTNEYDNVFFAVVYCVTSIYNQYFHLHNFISCLRAQGSRASGIHPGPGPAHARGVCSRPVPHSARAVWTPASFVTSLTTNQRQGDRGSFLQEDNRNCSYRETSE